MAAKDGDMIAAKLCMEHIYTKPQLPPEKVPEGIVNRDASHAEQSTQILQAASDGVISAALADRMVSTIAKHMQTVERVDLAERVTTIKAAQGK